jgi:hypothetical protein
MFYYIMSNISILNVKHAYLNLNFYNYLNPQNKIRLKNLNLNVKNIKLK